jgi:O-antigen ligase
LIVGTALILIVPYWFTIGPRQASVLRVASLLAFLAVVAMRTGGDGSRYRLRVPDVAAICLVALVILSWVTDARDPHESLQLTLNAILPITFFFSVRCLGIEVTRPLLWCALLAGALASLSVFYELLLTHEPVFINARDYLWNARPGEIFRPGGVFGSPAAAAAVLSTTTLCGSALLRKTDGVQRLVVVACLALGAGATFATFTRAGVIGLAVGSVVALGLNPSTARLRLLLAVVASGTLVGIFVLPAIQRALWFQEGVLRHGTLEARQSYWSEAFPLATNTPRHLLIGHGVNSLVVGRPELPGEPDPDLATAPTLLAVGPHNQYVRTLLEEGVVGLSVLLLWLSAPVVAGVRGIRRGVVADTAVAAAATGATVSFMVVSAAADSLRNPPSFVAIAIATGLLGIASSRNREAAVDDGGDSSE